MTKLRNILGKQFPKKQSGSGATAILAIIALVAIGGGVAYLTMSDDSSSSTDIATTPQSNITDVKQQETKAQTSSSKPEVEIDPDIFCQQISEVGNIFGEELTGATIRKNVSFGPQVGCSWNGPYVLVYFGNDSYNRRNTGFGSDHLVTYAGTDLEAVKKEKYAVHSGFEVEVKSDKGIGFRISQSTGRQTDLTPDQYNRIAKVVNTVLNQHY